MSVFELFIPNWHPATLNELIHAHWATAQRLKDADFAMMDGYRLRYGLPKASGKRRITLQIVRKPRQQGEDVDAYWKSLLDAMKRSGLIIDDSRLWVETMPVTYSERTTPFWGTRMTLEDLS